MEIVEIKERLTAIARREVFEEVVTPKGQKVKVRTSNKDAVKALELLCKISGIFAKPDIDVNVEIPIVIDDDLRQ